MTSPQSRVCSCGKPANKQCSQCRTTFYCSTDCQSRDWEAHKSLRKPVTVKVVLVEDQDAIEEDWELERLGPESGQPWEPESGQLWEPCPAPRLLGIPLSAIKRYRPPSKEPRRQIATFLMIDPQSGVAPPRWQGGSHNHLGCVAFARLDGRDFTLSDFWKLYSYLYNLMNFYSEPDEKTALSMLTPERYAAASRWL